MLLKVSTSVLLLILLPLLVRKTEEGTLQVWNTSRDQSISTMFKLICSDFALAGTSWTACFRNRHPTLYSPALPPVDQNSLEYHRRGKDKMWSLVHSSIHPSVHPSSICLSTCELIHLPIHSSHQLIYPLIHPTIYPWAYLSVLSIHCRSTPLPTYSCFHLSHPPIHPSFLLATMRPPT